VLLPLTGIVAGRCSGTSTRRYACCRHADTAQTLIPVMLVSPIRIVRVHACCRIRLYLSSIV
jgi:hypothetical protein